MESSLHMVSQILLPIFAPHRTRRPNANPTNLLNPQAHRYFLITCAWTCRKRHPLFEQVHCHVVCKELNLKSARGSKNVISLRAFPKMVFISGRTRILLYNHKGRDDYKSQFVIISCQDQEKSYLFGSW